MNSRRYTSPAAAIAFTATVTAVIWLVSLTLGVHAPQYSTRSEEHLYFAVMNQVGLPNWWLTTLFTVAAVGFVAVGIVCAAAGERRFPAWFIVAGVAALFSFGAHTRIHMRWHWLARQIFDQNNELADRWLVQGVLGAIALFVATVIAVKIVSPVARNLILVGVTLVLIGEISGELVVELVPIVGTDSALFSTAEHLARLCVFAGALTLIFSVARSLELGTDGPRFAIRYRTARRVAAEDRNAAQDLAGKDDVRKDDRASAPNEGRVHKNIDAVPGSKVLWPLLIGFTLLISFTSFTIVQILAVTRGPAVSETVPDEFRIFFDVLEEANLPTWWSCALLIIAALTNFLAGGVAMLSKSRATAGWLVTGAVLVGLALDDHTQLHERSEGVGRAIAGEGDGFPFYWLIPGVVVAVTLAALVGILALRVKGWSRWLLIGGLGLLFACALGLEAVQGLFLASGNENLAFRIVYHVEELGENVAILMLLGAAVSALSFTARAQSVVVGYTAGGGASAPDESSLTNSPAHRGFA